MGDIWSNARGFSLFAEVKLWTREGVPLIFSAGTQFSELRNLGARKVSGRGENTKVKCSLRR